MPTLGSVLSGVVVAASLIAVVAATAQDETPVLSLAEAQDVQSLAASVYESVAGTQHQQNAGFIMRAWVFNHAMDECMSKQGYPEWDWSASRQYARPTDPLASSIWFATPHRAQRSELLMSQQRRLLAEETMNQESAPERQKTILECSLSTPDASEAAAEAATRPTSASKLVEEWNEMVSDAGADAGDASTYYDCMDSSDVTVLDDSNLPSTELARALSMIDPPARDTPRTPTDSSARSEVWLRFVALEKEATDADWQCRKDVYLANIGNLPSLINDFVAEHRDEIDQAKSGWEFLEAEAAGVGYTGQPGPLGAASMH